jgi:hypothetical protein
MMQTGSIDEFIDSGIAFAGAPDNIFEQICEFDEHVDGLGHLLMMYQRGYLSHEETVQNLILFNQEVLPRLKVLWGYSLLIQRILMAIAGEEQRQSTLG